MQSYKAKAIILKSYKLGETDKIIRMYSSDGDIISKIILKTQASGGDSSPLLFKLIYMSFNEINNTGPEDAESLKKIMCFFGIKFLRITGYTPLLEICSKCNRHLKDLYSFNKDKVCFSVSHGGILCEKRAE